ncbi:MAG: hypothetical protein FWG12_07865 [Holophagaceae bacterium]|nr:hypothetical protein [Holophagaceae bacterium]
MRAGGYYRLVFYWDGFLDPADRTRMTRLKCERGVEMTAFKYENNSLATVHPPIADRPVGGEANALPEGGAEMDRAVYDPTADTVRQRLRLDKPHGRAVKHLLDAMGADGPGGDRLVAVVFENETVPGLVPAMAVAWFRYDPSKDLDVEVSYFLTPLSKSYQESWVSDYFHINSAGISWDEKLKFSRDLERMYEGRQPLDGQRIKQVTIPLPPGLRNDELMDCMRRLHVVAYRDKVSPFTWGVKSAGTEIIRDVHSHEGNPGLLGRVEDEFIWPIAKAILERETPKRWKINHQKHLAGKLGNPARRPPQPPNYGKGPFADELRRRHELAKLPK